MFCKNCGKEIKGTEKFCPACGCPVVPQATEKAAGISEQPDAEKNVKGPKIPEKQKKSHRKVICAVLIVSLIAGGVGIGVKKFGGAEAVSKNEVQSETKGEADQSAREEKTGFDKKEYKDLPFSRKQVKELEKIYNQAYEDELKSIDPCVAYYIEHHDEYADIKEMVNALSGTTEVLYEAVNELDPNLKKVIAMDAGAKFGNSFTTSYLVQKGVGVMLSDSELGREIRALGEILALTGLELLFEYGDREAEKEIMKSDYMVPVTVTEEYAVVRSYGNIDSMLKKLDMTSKYTILGQVLEELNTENDQAFKELPAISEDSEEMFQRCKMQETLKGRRAALEKRKSDLQDEVEKGKKELLKTIGVEEADGDVQYQHVFSIIDKEGKVYSSFLVPYAFDKQSSTYKISMGLSDEGMCSVSVVDGNIQTSYTVMDKEGTVLFQSSEQDKKDGAFYDDITPCGNFLRETNQKSFENGEQQVFELVKPDGTSKEVLSGKMSRMKSTGDGNYYDYNINQGPTGALDMTTGELLTNKEYEAAAGKMSKQIGERLSTWVDNEYRVNDDYVFRKDEKMIYDNTGKAVKDLSAGEGVYDIVYGNEKYWIATKSGFYYVLDKDFKNILEPVNLPRRRATKGTAYGVIVEGYDEATPGDSTSGETYRVYLYDEKGEKTAFPREIPGDIESKGFLAWEENLFQGTVSGAFNLHTKEPVLISMPEKPIHLTIK